MLVKQIGLPTREMPWVPLHVQIEITWKCNWRCVHCYQDDHKTDRYSTQELKSLLDDLHAAGTVHLIVTGGEPLVRSDLVEVIRHARKLGMTVTLYTNAHLVTEDRAKELGGLIGTAEISLLAGEPALHDQLARAPGSFDRAMRGATLLRQQGVNVVIKTPVLRPAYQTLGRLKALMASNGFDWQTDPEISQSYAGAQFPIAYKLNKDELRKFFVDFPEFNPQSGVQSNDPGVVNGMCLAGRRFCFIDAIGNVYPCLNFKNAMDRFSTRLGNVFETPFASIWGEAAVLKEIRSASFGDFKVCGGCDAKQGCRQCMALNFEEHGSLFQPARIVCGLTKAAVSVFDPYFLPASEKLPQTPSMS